MDNVNKKKIGLILGVILLFFAFRSVIVIDDLLTGIFMLMLGISVLYNNSNG